MTPSVQSDALTRLEDSLSPGGSSATDAARYKRMYDRAATLARFGVWECDLATSALCWSDGVYDMFEMERGSIVDRQATVAMYDPASRRAMERMRSHAIATRGGFTLDARIRTLRGRDRWIRLTADVECEAGVPVRLFGSKQDITDEMRQWTQMRRMAEQDPLTGLANRGLFQSVFDGPARLPLAALVLVDLDGFKQINDSHGHAAGDACLCRVADRLNATWAQASLVARLGGDEFAVLLGMPTDAHTVSDGVRATLDAIARPIPWRDVVLQVGGSVGVAVPVDPYAFDASTLFAQADSALYAAKRAGKGRARVYASSMRRTTTPAALPVPLARVAARCGSDR